MQNRKKNYRIQRNATNVTLIVIDDNADFWLENCWCWYLFSISFFNVCVWRLVFCHVQNLDPYSQFNGQIANANIYAIVMIRYALLHKRFLGSKY